MWSICKWKHSTSLNRKCKLKSQYNTNMPTTKWLKLKTENTQLLAKMWNTAILLHCCRKNKLV